MDFSITGTPPSCPLVNVDDDPSSSVQGKYLLHTSVGEYSRIEEIIHQFLFLLKRFDAFRELFVRRSYHRFLINGVDGQDGYMKVNL